MQSHIELSIKRKVHSRGIRMPLTCYRKVNLVLSNRFLNFRITAIWKKRWVVKCDNAYTLIATTYYLNFHLL